MKRREEPEPEEDLILYNKRTGVQIELMLQNFPFCLPDFTR
jgi:hypothetical protein